MSIMTRWDTFFLQTYFRRGITHIFPRQESVTIPTPLGREFSPQPIIHLRPEEQLPVASMGHIVLAEIDGEPVRTMVVLHSGYSVVFRNK